MSQELHYTSVSRGLKPGARGFCTVASTAGLSPTLAERLEGLSGYRANFPPDHPQAAMNPVAWSHLRLSAVGQTVSVVSRTGPAGLDYTDRPNKYAHHVVLDAAERPAGGPAWLLEQPGFAATEWHGPPQQIAVGRRPPTGDRPGGICRAWADRTGDAGWGGVVAEAFLSDPRRPVVVVYDPGDDVLHLFTEALALLPADRRWEVTFQTYFTGLPPGITCLWRGVLRDTAEERQTRGNRDALMIDLADPGRATGGALVHWARTGEAPAVTASPIPDRAPSDLAATTPPPPRAARSSTKPTPDPVVNDPYALTPPPITGKFRPLRESRPRPARNPDRTSPWPMIAVSALAFILGTTIGGAAVYLLLQARVPAVPTLASNKQEPTAKAESLPTATTQQPLESKPPATSEAKASGDLKPAESISSQTAPHETRAVKADTASEKAGIAQPPGRITPTVDATKPKGESATSGSAGAAPKDVQDKIRKPAANGPFPLKYFPISAEPQFTASANVQGVQLIGGEDSSLKPYKFLRNRDSQSANLIVTASSDAGSATIGTFSWTGSTITFEWSSESSATAINPRVKQAFQDCILEIELERGSNQYALLRQPKFLAQVKRNLNQDGKIITFEWLEKTKMDDREPALQNSSFLHAFKLESSMTSSNEFVTEAHNVFASKNKYFKASIPTETPTLIRVELTLIKPRGNKLEENKAYLAGIQNQLTYARSLTPPDKNSIQTLEEERDNYQRNISRSEDVLNRFGDFAKASIDATVIFKFGGKQFLLPAVKWTPNP